MTPAERVDHCIDWRRRLAVLETLSRREAATWRPYVWEADDGRLADHLLTCPPRRVVILDGAYSAHPELGDLLDLRVMLDVPDEVRRQRLRRREGEHYRATWEARWALAEEYYFAQVMPPEAFDLVIRSEDM
jgi:uridine kinase